MAAAEVKILDGVVGHDVTVVESDVVETYAASEFQAVVDVPFVLQVEAVLAEFHFCIGVGDSVVAIGKANGFGSSAIDEVVYRAVAVVTCSATHIGVVGELVFKVESCGHLVISSIPCEVVGKAGNLVLHTVVVGEEFVAEAHVGRKILFYSSVGQCFIAVHDVYKGEVGRVGTAFVGDIGVGKQQLVGKLVAEPAIEVGRQ